MHPARVYSYLRFSDPKQAFGHSAVRQLQYASDWAASRGLILDEELCLKDEGVSAFHQHHIKYGALGVFLQAIDEGRVSAGSVLIVEGLDRLSRAEPIQAQAQLAQIINAGITVVTASDGREYNREGLKAQPMDLVYSLLVMIRAHEESDTKSKRVKSAIRRQCLGWIGGTYKGLVRSGGDPSWVRYTGKIWEFIPGRVEAIEFAISKYREGHGAKRTFQLMAREGHRLNAIGLNIEQLYRLVKLGTLKGSKRLSIDGEDFELKDYYPRIMSDAEFDQLQLLTQQRSRRRGKGAIPGVITGVALAYCGYCGTSMSAQNQMGKALPDGLLLDRHRRIGCLLSMRSVDCLAGSSSVAPIERALMAYCSDQVNLQRLQEPTAQGEDLRARLVGERKAVDEVERQLARVTEALLISDGEGATPLVFVRKARELEEQLTVAKAAAQTTERELSGAISRLTPADAGKWAELAAGVDAQNVEARDLVRQLVMDTFTRIVIYVRGLVPEVKSPKYIDVLLISKAGQRRWMRIERRTGEWAAGCDRPV